MEQSDRGFGAVVFAMVKEFLRLSRSTIGQYNDDTVCKYNSSDDTVVNIIIIYYYVVLLGVVSSVCRQPVWANHDGAEICLRSVLSVFRVCPHPHARPAEAGFGSLHALLLCATSINLRPRIYYFSAF